MVFTTKPFLVADILLSEQCWDQLYNLAYRNPHLANKIQVQYSE